jgi:hypothetical protein
MAAPCFHTTVAQHNEINILSTSLVHCSDERAPILRRNIKIAIDCSMQSIAISVTSVLLSVGRGRTKSRDHRADCQGRQKSGGAVHATQPIGRVFLIEKIIQGVTLDEDSNWEN